MARQQNAPQMRNLDDLESGYRAQQQEYQQQYQGQQKNAFEHGLATNRAAAAANNVDAGSARLNNFNNGGAVQNLAEAGQRAAFGAQQVNDQYNTWADSRQVQHERNLQNAAMENRDMETRMKYDSQNHMADSLASGMQGTGGYQSPLGGLTANSAPRMDIYNNRGARIGGSILDPLTSGY